MFDVKFLTLYDFIQRRAGFKNPLLKSIIIDLKRFENYHLNSDRPCPSDQNAGFGS